MGITKWITKMRSIRKRIHIEDALKHLHASDWQTQTATIDSIAGSLSLSTRAAIQLCTEMESQNLIRSMGDGVHLTDEGRTLALQVIRSHRLWERYLADEAQMPYGKIHAEADKREHKRTSDQMETLDAVMGYPTKDPHGDPIPKADGRIERCDYIVLTDWEPNIPAVVVHIEDEPKDAIKQIISIGIRPGMRLHIVAHTKDGITLQLPEATHTLPPAVCANIHVCDAALVEPSLDQLYRPLTDLTIGEEATIAVLSHKCRGLTRRRLLDLGLTPGTSIQAELSNIGSSARAYRLRGTLIALRSEQANHILLKNKVNNNVSKYDNEVHK